MSKDQKGPGIRFTKRDMSNYSAGLPDSEREDPRTYVLVTSIRTGFPYHCQFIYLTTEKSAPSASAALPQSPEKRSETEKKIFADSSARPMVSFRLGNPTGAVDVVSLGCYSIISGLLPGNPKKPKLQYGNIVQNIIKEKS